MDTTPLLGAVCKLNSNGPEMTIDDVVWERGRRLRVVWFANGAFFEAFVAPQSVLIKEPVLAPNVSDADRAAIRSAHEAAMGALEYLKLPPEVRYALDAAKEKSAKEPA